MKYYIQGFSTWNRLNNEDIHVWRTSVTTGHYFIIWIPQCLDRTFQIFGDPGPVFADRAEHTMGSSGENLFWLGLAVAARLAEFSDWCQLLRDGDWLWAGRGGSQTRPCRGSGATLTLTHAALQRGQISSIEQTSCLIDEEPLLNIKFEYT